MIIAQNALKCQTYQVVFLDAVQVSQQSSFQHNYGGLLKGKKDFF
jgi:hypothetical protein